MKFYSHHRPAHRAFTMVELLIVIAVIGVMSALVISAFSGAAQDTRRVIARQQQAAVQNAVNAWVNSKSAEFDTASGKPFGISGARTVYNNSGTAMAKLRLVGGNLGDLTTAADDVEGYLDNSTLEQFEKHTSNANQIQSHALKKISKYITLETWVNTSYPKVVLLP